MVYSSLAGGRSAPPVTVNWPTSFAPVSVFLQVLDELLLRSACPILPSFRVVRLASSERR